MPVPRVIASPSYSDCSCPLQYSKHGIPCSIEVPWNSAQQVNFASNELRLWTLNTQVPMLNVGTAKVIPEKQLSNTASRSRADQMATVRCILPVSRNNNHIVSRSSVYLQYIVLCCKYRSFAVTRCHRWQVTAAKYTYRLFLAELTTRWGHSYKLSLAERPSSYQGSFF